MAGSSSTAPEPRAGEILKLWVSIPTKALLKRYMKAAGTTDKGRATAVLTQYKNLLALKILMSDYDDELLAAPTQLHIMWQQHILSTALYADNCRTLCGRTLHHAATDPADDPQRHTKRCQRSLAAFKKFFGDDAPADLWDFGVELPALPSAERERLLDDAPAAKRAKVGASVLNLSVQAPHLPLRTLTARSDQTVQQLFQKFVDASGSTHLLAGRNATPPTTRLRCGNAWMHDVQQLADAGVEEGSVIYVAVPQDRHSRDQWSVSIKDVAGGESAIVYVRGGDAVFSLMRQAQDALGVPADSQQLIFRGQVLKESDTLACCGITDGVTVQMAVGRRRHREAQMSPGGTWR